MKKYLAISIPTYNRADLLDQQLAWVRNAIQGYEAECEVIVSNNCSTDHTKAVLEKWQSAFHGLDFTVYHNSENIGAIRNIARCIELATARHVWVASDDDQIFEGTLGRVVDRLKSSPNLGLMFLNFTARLASTGEVLPDYGFRLSEDEESENGKALFEKFLGKDGGWGSLVFTTALVYRTDLAQRAIAEWQAGLDNLMFQLYITGFCAMNGPMLVTQHFHLDFMYGRSFFYAKKYFIKMWFVDIPEIFVKLKEMGCSPSLCQRLILKKVRDPKEWILAAKLLIKRPLWTPPALVRFLQIGWEASRWETMPANRADVATIPTAEKTILADDLDRSGQERDEIEQPVVFHRKVR